MAFANAGYSLADYARVPIYEIDTRVPWPVFPVVMVPDTVSIQADESNEVESCRFTGGIQYALNETLSLVTYIGLSSSRQEQAVRQALSYRNYPVYNDTLRTEAANSGFGYLANIQVSYKGERDSGSVSVTHDVVDSGASAQTLNRTSLNTSWRRRITSELRANTSVRYFLNKSDDDSISSDPVDEQTLTFSAALSYDYSDRWSFNIGVSHTDLRDEDDDTRKKRNLFFFRVTYACPLAE